MEIIILGTIFLFCTFVQGFTSFGFALLAIPLLSNFLDTRLVIVLTVTYSFVINSIIVSKLYKNANLKRVLPLLIAAIICTILGVLFLQSVDEFWIKGVIGLLLVSIGVINYFGISFSIRNPERYYLPVGMLSGTLYGICGVSGPPVLLFLSGIDMDRMEFKATLSSYLFTLNTTAIIMFLYKGMYTPETTKVLMTYLPFVITGAAAGLFTAARVSEKSFRKVVDAGVPMLGMNMLWKLFV